jgi:hypothetical protein
MKIISIVNLDPVGDYTVTTGGNIRCSDSSKLTTGALMLECVYDVSNLCEWYCVTALRL